MIARINIMEYPQDQFEVLFDHLKEVLFPVIKQQKGFQDLLVLRNEPTGKAYIIFLWDSREAVQNWLDSAAFKQVGVSLQKRSGFEWQSRPPFEEYQVLHRL